MRSEAAIRGAQFSLDLELAASVTVEEEEAVMLCEWIRAMRDADGEPAIVLPDIVAGRNGLSPLAALVFGLIHELSVELEVAHLSVIRNELHQTPWSWREEIQPVLDELADCGLIVWTGVGWASRHREM